MNIDEILNGAKTAFINQHNSSSADFTPKLLEHNDARWLKKSELDSVNWIPADIEAVNYLKQTMED